VTSNLFDSSADPREALDFVTSVIESSTEYSIIGKDLNGRIVLWNEGARRLYGYEAGEVVGRVNSDVLHTPDDVAKGVPAHILQAALDHGKWEGVVKRVRKNGTRFDARVVVTPRRDASGRPIGFLLMSKDISGEVRATEELREQQAYTRGLVEANIDALMATDPLGVITDVNRQMCAMTGFQREELIGTPMKRYFTDPERAEDGIRQVLAEDRVANYELVMRAKDGKEIAVSCNAATFRDANGRLQGVFAAARDISDQRALEAQLRRAHAYTRGLIEASLDPMITVSEDGAITDVNQQMERITGVPREQLIGSRFDQYFTDPPAAAAGVAETFRSGAVHDYVLVLRARDGREALVSFNAAVYEQPDGRQRGIFAVARDVTEQKRMEEELRRSELTLERLNAELEERVQERTSQLEATNKELEAFTYAVSHDLRAPLRAIDGFSMALMEDAADRLDEVGKGYVRRVRAAVERMADLIDDLLKLSRLTRGELRIEEVDLSAMARAVADELRATQPERPVTFEIADGLLAFADQSLIRAAMENLLGNAWKFSRNVAHAQIEVGAAEIGGCPAFFVRDNGAGFDMAFADKLFGAFQRLHTKEEFEGNGIGLATVQRIIHRHGGRVWGEGEVGKGATFWFTVPAREDARAPEIERSGTDARSTGAVG